MSLEYAENRIREALKLTKGNQAKARQQIIAWACEDARLMQALARPHLSGIVAYNVERVASGRADARHEAEKNIAAPKASPKEKAAPKKENFGLEILKAAAGQDTQIFGLEDTGAPQKRGQASQAHIDALKSIASKSKHTKKP
ncbi:MAG: hypothetical protein IT559_05075 [Alphaproteobacteria bacterium]|nr:hypothetical protein [Alphaproteobacteria bacterium]